MTSCSSDSDSFVSFWNELNSIVEPEVPSVGPQDGKEDGVEVEDEEASEEAWEEVGEGSVEGGDV